MIDRLRDALAPRRQAQDSERGYRRLLRWAALPVTDRRWAAPLCAVAVGFGLFAGVAIGPGAAGTLATAPFQLIEMPIPAADSGEGEGSGGAEPAAAPRAGSGGGSAAPEEAPASFDPVVLPEEEFEAGEEEPAVPPPAAQEKPEEEAAPETEELVGTVVHVNPAAGSYTVAEEGGVMSAVHAGKLPAAGTTIEVPIRSLANGTLAEAGKRQRTGSKKRATLAGIVTYVGSDPAAPTYAVSNRGSSLLVHVAPDPAGALPPPPALGAYATVTAGLDPAGLLWQQQLSSGGAPFTHADFEGIVAAVEAEPARLLLSADDRRESAVDLAISVPPGIDVSKLVVGDSVLASADLGADGALTLTGLASDERLEGADDDTSLQGDLVSEQPKGNE